MMYDFDDFFDCIDFIRTKMVNGEFDDDYKQALTYMNLLWDEDAAQRINNAVGPIGARPIGDERVIILLSAYPLGYGIAHKNRNALMQGYDFND